MHAGTHQSQECTTIAEQSWRGQRKTGRHTAGSALLSMLGTHFTAPCHGGHTGSSGLRSGLHASSTCGGQPLGRPRRSQTCRWRGPAGTRPWRAPRRPSRPHTWRPRERVSPRATAASQAPHLHTARASSLCLPHAAPPQGALQPHVGTLHTRRTAFAAQSTIPLCAAHTNDYVTGTRF